MPAPRTSMLTKLYYAETLTGDRKQVADVQSIPQLKTPKDPVTYNALDYDSERQTKGSRKIETITIPILYTEDKHDELQAMADSDKAVYWFIQLPEETASTEGAPLTWYFQATCDLANDALEIDGMIQENLTLYRESEIKESKGFPV